MGLVSEHVTCRPHTASPERQYLINRLSAQQQINEGAPPRSEPTETDDKRIKTSSYENISSKHDAENFSIELDK